MKMYHIEECIEMWFIKAILLGLPRLGKTTLHQRLIGEIIDIESSGKDVHSSTGVVDSGRSVVITTRNVLIESQSRSCR